MIGDTCLVHSPRLVIIQYVRSIFAGIAKAEPIQFNLLRSWLLVVRSIWWKVGGKLVRSWWNVVEELVKLVKSLWKVGEKFVKLVNNWPKVGQWSNMGQIGQKLVKNGSIWSSGSICSHCVLVCQQRVMKLWSERIIPLRTHGTSSTRDTSVLALGKTPYCFWSPQDGQVIQLNITCVNSNSDTCNELFKNFAAFFPWQQLKVT